MARSKPLPRSKRTPVINRGLERSRNTDTTKNISVGLMDIDSAIQFYFDNIIKPKVKENGTIVKVPTLYGSPERWAQAQKRGFLYDNKQKLIIPLIVFKRTSIEKDTDLSADKLNPKDPKLFYSFQKKYTTQNRYDKFSVQQGLNQSRELYKVAVPDYVRLSYDFVVWTSYVEQMNKIVEQIIYSEGSYWGEDGRFKFRTQIDNYTDASEINVNQERIIKTTFSVTLNGYLIPEEFGEKVVTEKEFTPKRVVFNLDATYSPDELEKKKGLKLTPTVNPVTSISVTNPIGIFGGTGVTLGGEGAGELFDGSVPVTKTISIGQDVSPTANVQFNSMTSNQIVFGNPTTWFHGGVSGSLGVTGSWDITEDMTVLGNAVVHGTLTARQFHTEFVTSSIIFASGSTRFGDTLDDIHQFTGSVKISGSLEVGGYSVNEVSNDISLTDENPNALVTEFALANYTGSEFTANVALTTYLRKNFFKLASSITGTSTASFTAVTASAPSGSTATSEQDFIFFINGQYMEHDAIEIKQINSNTIHLLVNTGSIGYDLEGDDEIFGFGKFDS